MGFDATITMIENAIVIEAMARNEQVCSDAARELKMNRTTLTEKRRKLGMLKYTYKQTRGL